MMLAALRPESWNFPLFVHVLGAILLAGSIGAVTVLAVAGRKRSEHAALLSRLAFRTLIFAVLPSWIVMRVGAQLIADKEFPGKAPGWVDVGLIVSEPGLIVLIALGVLAWASARRGGVGRASLAVAVLSPVYLAALAVAWWAMSAKPGG
jgi:cytochrome bd-type quinol oxidase subunit 2